MMAGRRRASALAALLLIGGRVRGFRTRLRPVSSEAAARPA